MCKETSVHVSTGLALSDPHKNPVLIIGQLKHLLSISYADVSSKFDTRVSEAVSGNIFCSIFYVECGH